MMTVSHKVFLLDNEEWVVDSYVIFEKAPPMNSIVRISDKKRSHLPCSEVEKAPLVRWMPVSDIFHWLNPDSKTTVHTNQNANVSTTYRIDGSMSDLTNVASVEEMDQGLPPPAVPMTVEEAMFVESLRTGKRVSTYRRVSEQVREIYPHLVPEEAVGHQWQGQDLVETAFRLLEGMEVIEAAKDPELQHLLDKWFI